jgi:hypothetical protein
MIANGAVIASQGRDLNWPTYLACIIVKKTAASLPAACVACFAKYYHS